MVNRSQQVQIPVNLSDHTSLRLFLETLLNKIDEAYGARGDNKFVDEKTFNSVTEHVSKEVVTIKNNVLDFKKTEDGVIVSSVLLYDASSVPDVSNGYSLVYNNWVYSRFIPRNEMGQSYTYNPQQNFIGLSTYSHIDVGGSYSQTEIQHISDGVTDLNNKLNDLINSLIKSNILDMPPVQIDAGSYFSTTASAEIS